MSDITLTTDAKVTVTASLTDQVGLPIAGAVGFAVADPTIAAIVAVPTTDGTSQESVSGVAAGSTTLTLTAGSLTKTLTVTVAAPAPSQIVDTVSAPVAKA